MRYPLGSIVALLAALALVLGPNAPVTAQEPAPSRLTIESVTLEGGDIVVAGTLTCTEAVTGYVDLDATQVDEEALGASANTNQDIACRPGEATAYKVRVPSTVDGRSFSGGRYLVNATVYYECVDYDCQAADARGYFDVEGPPPAPTIVKTLRLTVYGTPGPDDAGRAVKTDIKGEGTQYGGLALCEDKPETEAVEGCEGGGRVYTSSFPVLKGSTLTVEWKSFFPQGRFEPPGQRLGTVTETLNADTTNEAWYDLDTNTGGLGTRPGAGDQQVPDNQQTGDDKDTGAEDDTQDDAQDDAQDDEQGEMPEEMPETGGGGLASGTTAPVSNAGAGLTMMVNMRRSKR